MRNHHLEIAEAGRHLGAVGREIGRDVGERVFAHQRLVGEQQAVGLVRQPLAEIERGLHGDAFVQRIAARQQRAGGGRGAGGEQSAAGDQAAHDARSGLIT